MTAEHRYAYEARFTEGTLEEVILLSKSLREADGSDEQADAWEGLPEAVLASCRGRVDEQEVIRVDRASRDSSINRHPSRANREDSTVGPGASASESVLSARR